MQPKLSSLSLFSKKLDYCNSLICGSPQFILDKLQRVQNSAARLVMKSRECDHVLPLSRNLHWLPVRPRIDYKISTLCFNTFTNSSLSISFSFYPSTPLPDTSVHPRTHAPCVFLSSKLSHLVKEHSPSQAEHNEIQWNILPYGLRHSESSPAFKTALKTHIFRSAY